MVYSIDELASDIRKAPQIPGVYVFRAADGSPLYVGKSRNLRARLSSYLRPRATRVRKVRGPRAAAATVALEPTGSDLAALLREIALVQSLEPPFNRRLRRPERYVYLAIDYREEFPRLTVTAAPPNGARVLGPFTPHARVANAIALVSDAFNLRTCADPQAPAAPACCFRLQLHACSAPCLGRIAPGDYGRDFLRAVQTLSGQGRAHLAGLVSERDRLAAAEQFEAAGRRQRIISGIETMRRRLFINRVWRDAVVAVQAGAAPGTVHLWGIDGSAVCAESVISLPDLRRSLDGIVDGLHRAATESLDLVSRNELDRRWVVYRWLRSPEGRRWSVPARNVSQDDLRARVAALARAALGLFAEPAETANGQPVAQM